MTYEFGIPVRDYASRQSMKSHNLLKKQICDVSHIAGLLTWNKCVIFENLSTTTNMESTPLCVLGKPNTKSMLIASHGLSGMGNG